MIEVFPLEVDCVQKYFRGGTALNLRHCYITEKDFKNDKLLHWPAPTEKLINDIRGCAKLSDMTDGSHGRPGVIIARSGAPVSLNPGLKG